METIVNLFYAVVIVCVEGVCDEFVVAKQPMELKECIEVAHKEKEKFLYLDSFATAICAPQTDYN